MMSNIGDGEEAREGEEGAPSVNSATQVQVAALQDEVGGLRAQVAGMQEGLGEMMMLLKSLRAAGDIRFSF